MMLITAACREQNRQLHAARADYGTSGVAWAPQVRPLADWGRKAIPDFGCGKATLAARLGPAYRVTNYDPCIAGIDTTPDLAALPRVQNASKSARIYDPPQLPQRAFSEDYPQGVRSDATGRLTHDIEGRPLTARWVVGRQVVGGEDVALPPAELDALAAAITGQSPSYASSRQLRGDAGRYLAEQDLRSGEISRHIYLSRGLPAQETPRVLGHEVGHAIAGSGAKIPSVGGDKMAPDGIVKQFRDVYHALNDPSGRRSGPLWGPKQAGYSAAAVPDELTAEAVRAYLSDPNYLKSVAPDVAARIRAYVNPNPALSRHVQFNSMLAPLLAAGGFGALVPAVSGEERQP